MRILFLSMEYPPQTGGGGIGSYVAEMAAVLAARGHEVHVLSCVPGQGRHDYRDGRVWIHRRDVSRRPQLAHLARSGKAALRLEVAVACFREARRLGRFDVVESPDWMAEGLIFALTGSAPLVGHLHTPLLVLARHNDKDASWDRRLGDALERITMRRAHAVTSPSRLLLAHLVRAGWLSGRQVRVIRYPLHLHRWEGLEGADRAPPRVLWVGRLEPRKAPETLVEAAAQLAREVDGLEVVFVGGSNYRREGRPYLEWTRALAHRLAAPCTFLGRVPRSRIPLLYERSRVAALTARFDNFPVAALEALAAARPLVCTTATGTAELVRGSGAGAVVPPQDPDALAEALYPFLADARSAAEAGRRGQALVARHCSPDEIAAEREACYRAAMEAWGRTWLGRLGRSRALSSTR